MGAQAFMKVILLGDSITQGLGSKKVNLQQELNNLLNPNDTVINMAMTGTTISYVNSIFPDILSEQPDYVVILYGNVDAMLKPNREGLVFQHLPNRFRMNDGAMLLPRPFYSHSILKSVGQHVENYFRTIFRLLIFKIDGIEQWMPYEQFRDYYEKTCNLLSEHKIKIIICSTVYIDERLFKGTNSEYLKYNEWLKEYSNCKGYRFIDLYRLFKELTKQAGWKKYYNHDHFHPNGEGYAIMAGEIAKGLLNP